MNANGSLTTLTWDDQNRLQVVELPAGGRVTHTYDHDGRRRQREDASGTVKFVWDGKRLLAELDSGGNTLARYTSGLDEFGPTVSQRRGASSSFYLPDALGSVLRLAGANESVTDSYVLDAWGAQIAASGSTTNPFRYVGSLGYYTESGLSLDYVRSRWLRPGTGSWLSVDPVLDQPPYTYAGQRPMFVVDPSGEVWLLLILFGWMVYVALCLKKYFDEGKEWKDRGEIAHQDIHCYAYCMGAQHCGVVGVGDWVYYASEVMQEVLQAGEWASEDIATNRCGARMGDKWIEGLQPSCQYCCGRKLDPDILGLNPVPAVRIDNPESSTRKRKYEITFTRAFPGGDVSLKLWRQRTHCRLTVADRVCTTVVYI